MELFIDTFFEGTNAEQHDVINAMAKKQNGKIIFYGAEDYFVAGSQPFILSKLTRTKNIDGVIFYTLNQFCYGDSLNLKLLVNILKLEMTVHFARESITFKNLNDLKINHLDLIAYYQAAFIKIANK